MDPLRKSLGLLVPLVFVAVSCEYNPSTVNPVQFSECDGVQATQGVGWTDYAGLGGPDPALGRTYTGTSGNDVVVITNGPVRYEGGDGDDLICVNQTTIPFGTEGLISIDGGGGDDRIVVNIPNEVVVTGGSGDDTILGGAGTRVVEDLSVRLAEDVLPANTVFDSADIPAVVAQCLSRLDPDTCASTPIFFAANDGQTVISEHIQDAQDAGFPSLLQYEDPSPTSRPDWNSRFPTSDCALTTLAKSDCDEYPYFATTDGWRPGEPEPSLRRVLSSANSAHGGSHGIFLRQCGLSNDSPGPTFAVVPVHELVPDDVKSFWVCGTRTDANVGEEHDPTNPAPDGQPCVTQLLTSVNRVLARNSTAASNIISSGNFWMFTWSPDLVDLTGVDHFEVVSDKTISSYEYAVDTVGFFESDYFSARPLNAELVLKDAADQEVGRVPCLETANGLDFIAAGTTDLPYRNGAPVTRRGCTHLGTAGDDVIEAGPGDDIVCPMAGNDVVEGSDGNDFFALYSGSDVASGGSGADFVNTLRGPDPLTILGGDGNDTAFGSRADDLFRGGDGDDQLFGDEGADFVDGEDGNDSILSGGPGNDVIIGGPGNDRSFPTGAAYRMETGDDLFDMGTGDDNVDMRSTTNASGNDTIFTGGGFDLAYGGLGDDRIFGGPGRQALEGGPGNDILDAEPEPLGALAGISARQDVLDGGDGNDLVRHVSPFESPFAFPIAPAPVLRGGNDNDLVIALDASFDSVYLEPTGIPIATLGNCTLLVDDFLDPGESATIECSFPFFGQTLNVDLSSDETTLAIDFSGDFGYFLDTLDGLIAAIDASLFGLESLTDDACICDPTITTSQGLVLLSDNQ